MCPNPAHLCCIFASRTNKYIKMDKKKEKAIMKLNEIKSWANDVIIRSRKMEKILESVQKSNPDIQDLTTFIDIGDARYGAELLIANIEDAIDDIERELNKNCDFQ